MKNMLKLLIALFACLWSCMCWSSVDLKSKYAFSKLKYIECDSYDLDEENNYSIEDNNIDESFLALANLTKCLEERHQSSHSHGRLSFSTHHGFQVDTVFSKYFKLDENTGLVYLVKSIDRESVCDPQQLLRSVNIHAGKQNHEDSIDCDCKSEKCELRFKFNAFRESNKKTSHFHLIFSVHVKDLNDNWPVFRNKFLSLNISEFIGTGASSAQALDSRQLERKPGTCPFSSRIRRESKNINDEFLVSNTLIPLETRAIDFDSAKYSSVKYELILLKSNSCMLINQIEAIKHETQLELTIRNLVADSLSNGCNNEFELVEASLNENFQPAELNNMLFLKVNKYLDREIQDCFNFVLIASDKNETLPFYSFSPNENINNNSFMFIRLTVIDLNDNLPRFDESKYIFNLNEATELSMHSPDAQSYYLNQLGVTCAYLRKEIRVRAMDSDLGANGQIKYKIIQQVNRKNPSFKANWMKIVQLTSDETESVPDEATLNPDAHFTIDKLTGQIYLKICDNLNRSHISRRKFLDLTMLLDYELYTKHIIVVEATDSSLYNPLQSFVTLEINILDLNDHAPVIISLYSSKCSANRDLNMPNNLPAPQVIIQRVNQHQAITPWLGKNFSSKLFIDGISEWTEKGFCLGQFLVTDLDMSKTNRKIEAFLIDADDNRKTETQFLFKSLKTSSQEVSTSSGTAQHEIFELFLNIELDAEIQRDYRYTLVLKDHGVYALSSFVEMIVLIRDENDNEPKFEQAMYQLKIDEWFFNPEYDTNDPVNTRNNLLMIPADVVNNYCISKIEAFDMDKSNMSSSISYKFVHLDPIDKDTFYYNETNNFVCVRNRTILDRETKNKYNFLLHAINNQSETKLSTSVRVEVILNDLNDNRPQFALSEYFFFVPETDNSLINSLMVSSPELRKSASRINVSQKNLKHLVGQVFATDRDLNQNADLKYFIKPNDNSNMFELNMNNLDNPYLKINAFPIKHRHIKNIEEIVFVNSSNGKIYLLKGIDREQITAIRFNLYVTDRRNLKLTGWPNEPLINQVPVVIEFIDINDSKPVCSNLDIYPARMLNSAPNYQIFIFSIYLNLNMFQRYDKHLLYNLSCSDNDFAKNAQLFYEFIELSLKEIDSTEAAIVQPDQSEIKSLFQLDAELGVLLLNMNPDWIVWHNESSNEISQNFSNYFNRYFFVFKFKISDHGMIPSFNYYTLKLRFCFNNRMLKYCDNNNINNNNNNNEFELNYPSSSQRLTSVDEEFFSEEKYDVNSSQEFSSKETEDFDDVSFINEEERLMNDILINNKSIGHPYPISFSSSSSAISSLKANFYLRLFSYFLLNKCRWLFS